MTRANGSQRPDFAAIAQCIPRAAHVLDLGCGDGTLLKYLQQSRDVTGYGVEIDDAKVLACVNNGVHVIQGDLERGQAMRNTERIVREMLRVGRAGIVTFPNFGHWKNRLQILLGRMPVSDKLPFEWFDTPNIHLCTVADFERFCGERGIRIVSRAVLSSGRPVRLLPNLFGELAVYHFSG
jgi:SAM-dependent methyltransferase